jgi:spore germination protein GerM
MTRTRILLALGFALLTASLVWLLFIGLPRWTAKPTPPPEETKTATVAEPEPATAPTAPHIKARLYYLSEDGLRLRPEEREILLGAGTSEQARRIVEAQLEPVQPPMASAIPNGTKLKELFISDKGEAYVDLSSEVSTNHTGGSLDEILTVYTIVDALTDNLPAISAVQILIDGKEVDTLAGHVDLRRPLTKNLTWVEAASPPSPSSGPAAH